MAVALDPDEVLCSTSGKDNFYRISRLLISGGTTLLREVFDQKCPPDCLPQKLNELRAAKLTKPQRDCLYPSPGTYGKSEDFDITLLFYLLKTICNLTPPGTGWDVLPAPTDHSLAADLARIKHYRNTVYGHVTWNMEIADDEFLQLWEDISQALIGIAGHISPIKKRDWQKAIVNLLNDPLTTDDERNVQELQEWYKEDMTLKQAVGELTQKVDKVLERADKPSKESKNHPPRECPSAPKGDSNEGIDIALIQLVIECVATHFDQRRESPRNRRATTQDVLNLAAQTYLINMQPSTPEEQNKFLDYLREIRRLLFIDAKEGSLIITVGCRSVQILDDLWKDYCAGRVTEMAQKYLVTKRVLDDLGLTEAKLTTKIPEEEYKTCRKQLSVYAELKQIIQRLKDYQGKLQRSFVKWAKIRNEIRDLLSEFVNRRQERRMHFGRASRITAAVGAALTTDIVTGLFAVLVYCSISCLFGENRRKSLTAQDIKALQEVALNMNHLQRRVAHLAVYCRDNTERVLSSRVLAREYPFILETLRKPGSEVRLAPTSTLSTLIERESNIHTQRLPRLVASLVENESNQGEAKRTCREILNELSEEPNEGEIKRMVFDFINEEFIRQM